MMSPLKLVDISSVKQFAVGTSSRLPPGLDHPPGLELPPGLSAEAKIDKPPGLEDISTSECMALLDTTATSIGEAMQHLPIVRITGIPNLLLTTPLMDTVFQQAQLEHALVGYTMERGSKWGEVRVSLSTTDAVAWCVRHFSGCQWVSGVIIRCEVISPAIMKATQEGPFLSPSAPVFVPASSSSMLSAHAPSFVPSSLKYDITAFKPLGDSANDQTDTPTSDASTDTGESASECE